MQIEESLERRIVTVLFADLVGFTTLSEQFDAEDIAHIQDTYFASVRETVGRYGGQLEKFIGDAAMAVFGVPRSRDDDAERAVRAGLALIGSVQQIGARLGLEEDALRLRVGVNTGEVVVAGAGGDEGRVTGDAVNTSARLQAAAPPNGVLAGEQTALAVADIAELGAVIVLELKGKAEPTRARLVEGFRLEPSREAAMGSLSAPTLGRDTEIDALLGAHRRAAADGVERLLVVAPPGVGKSRLMREVADRIRTAEPTAVLWRSRTRPGSVSPFEAVATLLSDAGAADDARLSAALEGAGVDAARAQVIVSASESALQPAGARDTKPSSDEREALFEAWLDALDALAGGTTQTWLIEDVHWAGGDTLAFLALAAERRPKQGGRLVITTARPSVLETNPDWAAESAESGRRVLHLPTLAATDASALVEALVGDALPAALVETIAQRSDGNCLFIEELLRTWISVGTLIRKGDKWTLSVPAEEILLPTNVQSIYAAQLDDLPPDARRLARRASVAGRRFPVGALERLGASAAGDGEDGLGPLVRRELISGPMTEPITGDTYAYRHALLRDAGYASLARAERARLHVRLARWLEQAAGERSAEVAEQVAGHYSSALESAPALAAQIGDGLDRSSVQKLAGEWYERAGQSTLALSAHEAARTLLRRSIDLTPDEARLDKARRWERLGDATAFAADMSEGAAAYEKALELYRSVLSDIGSGFDTGAAALGKAAEAMATQAEWLATIDPAAAEEVRKSAGEMLAGSADIQAGKAELLASLTSARSGLARTASSLADVMYQQLRFNDSRKLAEQVMAEVTDEADAGSRARLEVARAMGALGAGGPSPEIEERLERALELARQDGDPRVELQALGSLAVVRAESGRDDPKAWHQVAEAARTLGDWSTVVSASTNVIWALIDDRAGEAYAPIEETRQTALAHGLTEDAGWTHYQEAEAAFVHGDWDRALAAGLRAVDLGEANAYLRLTVRTLHVLVPIASVRGNRDVLERAASWYRGLEGGLEFPDSPYARIIRTAQNLELAANGLWDTEVPQVEPRIASFDNASGPSWSAALDRVLRAWTEAGELDGAERALAHLADSIAKAAETSSLELGTQELMRGRLAHAGGDNDATADHARSALQHFRTSAAPWWMAKAIRLLERAGAADAQLVAEVERIEQSLGAPQPTA